MNSSNAGGQKDRMVRITVQADVMSSQADNLTSKLGDEWHFASLSASMAGMPFGGPGAAQWRQLYDWLGDQVRHSYKLANALETSDSASLALAAGAEGLRAVREHMRTVDSTLPRGKKRAYPPAKPATVAAMDSIKASLAPYVHDAQTAALADSIASNLAPTGVTSVTFADDSQASK